MWASLALLALLAAIDPVRLGIILLVISRPRPVANLLAYGVGALAACSYMIVLPLAALNSTGAYAHPHPIATVRHIQLGAGVLALTIAAVTAVRIVVRPAAPTPAVRGDSAVWRLAGRARAIWQNSGLWVALLIGIATGGPQWDALAFLLAIVALSGAAVGIQVAAAAALVVGMLAIVEIALIGHLINPGKAQELLTRIRGWGWAHRRHVVAALAAVGGLALIANGTGLIGPGS